MTTKIVLFHSTKNKKLAKEVKWHFEVCFFEQHVRFIRSQLHISVKETSFKKPLISHRTLQSFMIQLDPVITLSKFLFTLHRFKVTKYNFIRTAATLLHMKRFFVFYQFTKFDLYVHDFYFFQAYPLLEFPRRLISP